MRLRLRLRLRLRERDLFQFVEDAVGFGEVPVEEELVDDGEVVSGLGEA